MVSESSTLVLRALPTTLLLLGTFLERSERLGLERVLGTFRTQAVCRSGQLRCGCVGLHFLDFVLHVEPVQHDENSM